MLITLQVASYYFWPWGLASFSPLPILVQLVPPGTYRGKATLPALRNHTAERASKVYHKEVQPALTLWAPSSSGSSIPSALLSFQSSSLRVDWKPSLSSPLAFNKYRYAYHRLKSQKLIFKTLHRENEKPLTLTILFTSQIQHLNGLKSCPLQFISHIAAIVIFETKDRSPLPLGQASSVDSRKAKHLM